MIISHNRLWINASFLIFWTFTVLLLWIAWDVTVNKILIIIFKCTHDLDYSLDLLSALINFHRHWHWIQWLLIFILDYNLTIAFANLVIEVKHLTASSYNTLFINNWMSWHRYLRSNEYGFALFVYSRAFQDFWWLWVNNTLHIWHNLIARFNDRWTSLENRNLSDANINYLIHLQFGNIYFHRFKKWLFVCFEAETFHFLSIDTIIWIWKQLTHIIGFFTLLLYSHRNKNRHSRLSTPKSLKTVFYYCERIESHIRLVQLFCFFSVFK